MPIRSPASLSLKRSSHLTTATRRLHTSTPTLIAAASLSRKLQLCNLQLTPHLLAPNGSRTMSNWPKVTSENPVSRLASSPLTLLTSLIISSLVSTTLLSSSRRVSSTASMSVPSPARPLRSMVSKLSVYHKHTTDRSCNRPCLWQDHRYLPGDDR